jgi:hypothetical protein
MIRELEGRDVEEERQSGFDEKVKERREILL